MAEESTWLWESLPHAKESDLWVITHLLDFVLKYGKDAMFSNNGYWNNFMTMVKTMESSKIP